MEPDLFLMQKETVIPTLATGGSVVNVVRNYSAPTCDQCCTRCVCERERERGERERAFSLLKC